MKYQLEKWLSADIETRGLRTIILSRKVRWTNLSCRRRWWWRITSSMRMQQNSVPMWALKTVCTPHNLWVGMKKLLEEMEWPSRQNNRRILTSKYMRTEGQKTSIPKMWWTEYMKTLVLLNWLFLRTPRSPNSHRHLKYQTQELSIMKKENRDHLKMISNRGCSLWRCPFRRP